MKKNQQGFVILFTILIATIILMIGLGIFSIATREIVLSSTAREAQYAFYAADAGVECALYAQSLGGATPFSTDGTTGTFPCGNNEFVSVSGNGSQSTPWEFSVMIDNASTMCTKVSVFDSGNTRRIIAQGYNICTSGQPALKNPLLVERDLDVVYEIAANSSNGTSTTTPNLNSINIQNPDLNVIKTPTIDTGLIIQQLPTN